VDAEPFLAATAAAQRPADAAAVAVDVADVAVAETVVARQLWLAMVAVLLLQRPEPSADACGFPMLSLTKFL
jgi:hypothetical protein